jgi:hypothetical protein
VRGRIKEMRHRVGRTTHRVLARFRRSARSADFWVQDHHVVTVAAMFVLLIAGAGMLLWTDWDAVIGLAKDLAPVVTILSVIASAFLGAIKWFRKRREVRLTGGSTPSMPRTRETEADRSTRAPGTLSGSVGEEDGDGEG